MKEIIREWDYWAYLFRVTHRESIPDIEQYDEQLVAFIVEALELEPGHELLDLACGSGVHGVRLGQQGMRVTGVDISPSLVAHANELARAKGVENVAFVVSDMREAPCAEACDAVTILSQSFGFFDTEGDMAVLRAMHTALRPGGRFLLDLNEPLDLEMPRQRWMELDGGFLLMRACYDPLTCVREATFRYIDRQGRVNVAQEPERIRSYTLPELKRMMDVAGLQFQAVYGLMTLPLRLYGPDCRQRRLVVGRKA
jgi:SAM-dependent methyltransferase